MGCGCNKKRATTSPPPPSAGRSVPSGNVVTYDVHDDEGTIVASSTNPAHARAEARKIGGVIRSRSTAQKGDA